MTQQEAGAEGDRRWRSDPAVNLAVLGELRDLGQGLSELELVRQNFDDPAIPVEGRRSDHRACA